MYHSYNFMVSISVVCILCIAHVGLLNLGNRTRALKTTQDQGVRDVITADIGLWCPERLLSCSIATRIHKRFISSL